MKKGFTLVELLVVITIVVVLSGIGLVFYGEYQKMSRDAVRKRDLRDIQLALEGYYQKNNRYPCSTNDFSGVDGDWNTSFQRLGQTSWISDQCLTSVNDPNFDSRYISTLPRDPINTNQYPWLSEDAYSYAYLSPEDIGYVDGCPSGKGQYYILVARLERLDKEVQKPEDVVFCDGDPVIGYHGGEGTEFVLMGADATDLNFDKLMILTSQE